MPIIINMNVSRALDISGIAVPGALASFYDSGTTRARAVYSDPACTIPHPQPLVADGAGVFPPVYDAGSSDVRVLMSDADGAMLAGFPVDPAMRVSTEETGAASVAFSPTTEIPVTNVQRAIERVQANIVAPLAEFGLGVTGIATLLSDTNAMDTASGIYRISDLTAGTFPAGVTKADGGIVRIWRENGNNAVMILSPRLSTRQYVRSLISGTWGLWRRVMQEIDVAANSVWAAGAATEPLVVSPASIRAALNAQVPGMGQTWANYPSRTHSTSYQNTAGRPITVAITADASDVNRSFQVSSDGSAWITVGVLGEAGSMWSSASAIIPAGWWYRILGAVGVIAWAELR